jgi:hypothetical protein
MLIAELAMERFVRTILPRLAGIDESRFDLRGLEPAQHARRHELGAVSRAEVARRAVDAHELGQSLNHPARRESTAFDASARLGASNASRDPAEDKPKDGNGHTLAIVEQTTGKFECGECGQGFDSQDEAAAHIAEVHPA